MVVEPAASAPGGNGPQRPVGAARHPPLPLLPHPWSSVVPEPATLTPAALAVLAHLHSHDGRTVAALTELTELGRSTVGKALPLLEQEGLARREQHGPQGGRIRLPDTWYTAAPTDRPEPDEAETTDEAAEPEFEPADRHSDPAQPQATGPAPDAAPDPGANPNEAVSAPDPTAVPNPTDPDHVAIKPRAAKGELRTKVAGHLAANPGVAFTPSRLATILGHSAGAIANALDTLTKQSPNVQQATDKPRAFTYIET